MTRTYDSAGKDLQEALRIARGLTMMLPERRHLEALYEALISDTRPSESVLWGMLWDEGGEG